MARIDIRRQRQKNYRQTIQLILGVLVAMLILITESRAQSKNTEGFIYGKVYTDNNVYTGQIRWGKEEAYWIDLFNASKVSSDEYKYVPKKENDENWNFDWRLSSIWEDKHSGTLHQFSCFFGDIAELENHGINVIIKLKNGIEVKVNGEGYNDIGTEVNVLDKEVGHVSVNWKSINKIEFLPTPSLTRYYGSPLYGTVETTRKGSFTGLIQWDHDERLGGDKLDGDTRDGDVSIEFSNIKRIEKYRNGSQVVLKSGRELYLTNSNDVNDENRGIIVMAEGIGHVDIPWRAFKAVNFDNAGNSGPAYKDFKSPSGIQGTVNVYDGSSFSGNIIYDIDEKWEFETLEGNDDEIKYIIPFKFIKKISPKNYDYSSVQLKNGEQLLIGGLRDVSDENDGLLIFLKGEKEPKYIPWKKITDIVLD